MHEKCWGSEMEAEPAPAIAVGVHLGTIGTPVFNAPSW